MLTNKHVIGNARGRAGHARGWPSSAGATDGIDDLSDSVVKIDAQNLETLPWGIQQRALPSVLATATVQLSGTVTLGIVSAASRSGVGGITGFVSDGRGHQSSN